jgi:predicted transcriptional regulator
MLSRCEEVGKHVLPVFRALIAKELVNTYNLTQIEAARRLGAKQCAICQYLNSKRAFKCSEQFGDILPILQAKAIEVAKRASKKEVGTAEVVLEFCQFCPSICHGIEQKETKDDYAI